MPTPQPTVSQICLWHWRCCYVIIVNDWDSHDLFVHCWLKLNSPVVSSPPLPRHYTGAYVCGHQGRWELLTGDGRHPLAGYLVTQMHDMTKLVLPAQRCLMSATACRSRFVCVGIRTLRYGGTATYGEVTNRSCLRWLRWSNIWGPGIKRNA